MIIAALVFATPAFATVDLNAVQTAPNAASVYITYTRDVNVRAFALDVNIDSGCKWSVVSGYKRGESNNVAPGYGIFPGRFRDYINAADPCWVDVNYTPVAPWDDPDARGGIGTNGVTLELGALFAGDGNRPATSGTLCRLDINVPGGVNDANVKSTANVARGKVVKEDASEATTNLPKSVKVVFQTQVACPNVVGFPCSSACGIIQAVDSLVCGNPTFEYSATVAAGTVISQNPLAGAPVDPGSTVNWVCSLGIAPPAEILYPMVDHDINVTVVWPPVTLATSYKLQRTADVNTGVWTQIYSGTNTGNYRYKVDNNGLTPLPTGSHYRYRVKSVSAAGDGNDWRTGTWDCNTYWETCYDANSTDGNYADWKSVAVGRARCWCFPRQCNGDADGKREGGLGNYWYVGNPDLTILAVGYLIKDPPAGKGLEALWAGPNSVPASCGDFSRTKEGGLGNYWRVGQPDVTKLAKYYLKKETDPNKPPATCVPGNRNPPWW